MTEVIPGIYQLKLPLPDPSPGHINAYLVKGDNGCLLIDTGWNTEETFESLKKQLDEIDIDTKSISQIVITHIHPDHYGLAGRLRRLSKAKIALYYLEKALIDSRYKHMENLLSHVARWLHTSGVPASRLPELQMASVGVAKFVTPVTPDVTLYDGDIISTGLFSFEVLWTPGHSPGHICLYEPSQKILVSGDHILPTITPNVGVHPESSINPLGDYINSINRIKQFDVELILPGHENTFSGLKTRIEELIQHHHDRNSNILKAIKSELKTPYQIATKIPWMSDTYGIGWQNMTPVNKRLAILETMAHLESMRADGYVSKLNRDGVSYYQPVTPN